MARRHSNKLAKYISPEGHFARKQAALWLGRLLGEGVPLCQELFDCYRWITGDQQALAAEVRAVLEQQDHRAKNARALRWMTSNIDPDDQHISCELDRLGTAHSCAATALQECILAGCAKLQNGKAEHPHARKARERLKKFFGLDDEACTFCEYVYLQQNFSDIEEFFEDELKLYKARNFALLGAMLDIPADRVRHIVQTLADSQLLQNTEENNYFRLVSPILPLWSDMPEGRMQELFCAPVKGETLPLEEFQLEPRVLGQVRRLLARTDGEPVHILLYGPPGTGKTTFARSLAKELGQEAYAVVCRENDDDADRRSSLVAASRMVERLDNAFVLADEAEHLLDTGSRFARHSRDKAWLNTFLEQPGRHIVWITNHVEHIEQAVLRRFSFSVHFGPLGLEQRESVVRKILARNSAGKKLSDTQLGDLVRAYDETPPAVFDRAVKLSRGLPAKGGAFRESVDTMLEAHTTLSHHGHKVNKAHAVSDYTLEGACLKGSASQLLEGCRRADAAMRSGESLRPGAATMLFYGPPGTGKTALARYIADTLRRECVVKRASDILSMWVGESEKHIARAFREAEAKGSVLVIDEVDSFLYSRDMIQRSWEGTQVNEFLTALEECRAFCICTTNRRTQLDEAAMRRFAHKVEFGYAQAPQLLVLYNTLLAPLCDTPLPSALQVRLAAMQRLTPGDFHAVQGQFGSFFTEPGSATHEAMLAALEREAKLKLEAKSVGF